MFVTKIVISIDSLLMGAYIHQRGHRCAVHKGRTIRKVRCTNRRPRRKQVVFFDPLEMEMEMEMVYSDFYIRHTSQMSSALKQGSY